MVFYLSSSMAQSGDLEHAVGGLVRTPGEFRPRQLQSMLCDARCARFPADIEGRPASNEGYSEGGFEDVE